MKNKNLSYFADGIMSGVFLCIGCAVNLSVDSPLAGAFLFSLGLFAIITFRLGLYTGKAGYMAMRPPSYIIEVILTLIGNITGAALGGWLLNLTRVRRRSLRKPRPNYYTDQSFRLARKYCRSCNLLRNTYVHRR